MSTEKRTWESLSLVDVGNVGEIVQGNLDQGKVTSSAGDSGEPFQCPPGQDNQGRCGP